MSASRPLAAFSRIGSAMRWLERAAIALLSLFVRLYQLTISPLLGPTCRFEPSCSRYLVEAWMKHGLVHGTVLGVRRLSRCHPWHPGGYDPP